ncbi:MAG TPA: hypothetical protein VE662_07635 [Solirubrobacterales bacterium]|nr:hypothetical protein [Solirubrobacterales bacterium]
MLLDHREQVSEERALLPGQLLGMVAERRGAGALARARADSRVAVAVGRGAVLTPAPGALRRLRRLRWLRRGGRAGGGLGRGGVGLSL